MIEDDNDFIFGRSDSKSSNKFLYFSQDVSMSSIKDLNHSMNMEETIKSSSIEEIDTSPYNNFKDVDEIVNIAQNTVKSMYFQNKFEEVVLYLNSSFPTVSILSNI